MKVQRLAWWTVRCLLLTALFTMFCYLLFPAAKVDTMLGQVLSRHGLTIAPPVHKTFIPGLGWDNLLLSSEQGPLFQCERLQIRPLLLPLFTGRTVVSGLATIGKGELAISYALNGTDALHLEADGIELADIPFFKSVLGAKMAGNLWSIGALKRDGKGLNGDLKLEIKEVVYSGIKLGNIPLPDASGLKVQGIIRVVDSKARLVSFTAEADGLYMRLSGDLPTGANAAATPLNMSLEIMPKPDFIEKQKAVFMLLARFMTSPGVYSVPIKGTLFKPVVM